MTRDSKTEMVTNVLNGVMFVEEIIVRKRVNLVHVLTAIKFADHQTALQNTDKGKEGREV